MIPLRTLVLIIGLSHTRIIDGYCFCVTKAHELRQACRNWNANVTTDKLETPNTALTIKLQLESYDRSVYGVLSTGSTCGYTEVFRAQLKAYWGFAGGGVPCYLCQGAGGW